MNLSYFEEKMNAIAHPDRSKLLKETIKNIEENFVGTQIQINEEKEKAKLAVNEKYRNQMDEYRKQINQVWDEFKQELFVESGIYCHDINEQKKQEINNAIFDKLYRTDFYKMKNKFEAYVDIAETVIKLIK